MFPKKEEKRETHILDGRDKFVEDILKHFKNGSFSDVRIILEDGEILANKDVLSTRCEYFAMMFSRGVYYAFGSLENFSIRQVKARI